MNRNGFFLTADAAFAVLLAPLFFVPALLLSSQAVSVYDHGQDLRAATAIGRNCMEEIHQSTVAEKTVSLEGQTFTVHTARRRDGSFEIHEVEVIDSNGRSYTFKRLDEVQTP